MTERTALRKLIRKLKKASFKITHISDGETQHTPKKESDIINTVFQFDDVWLYAKKQNGPTHWIKITLGNQEPADMFADWSFSDGDRDGFNVLIDDLIDELNA